MKKLVDTDPVSGNKMYDRELLDHMHVLFENRNKIEEEVSKSILSLYDKIVIAVLGACGISSIISHGNIILFCFVLIFIVCIYRVKSLEYDKNYVKLSYLAYIDRSLEYINELEEQRNNLQETLENSNEKLINKNKEIKKLRAALDSGE